MADGYTHRIPTWTFQRISTRAYFPFLILLILCTLPACPAARPEWRPVCREYALLEAATARNANLPTRIAVGKNHQGNPHATGQVQINGTWYDLSHDSYTVYPGKPELSETWKYYSPEAWASERRVYVLDVK